MAGMSTADASALKIFSSYSKGIDETKLAEIFFRDHSLDGINYQQRLDELTTTLLGQVAGNINESGLIGEHIPSFKSGDATNLNAKRDLFKEVDKGALTEDTKNLLFSHFPRNLGTGFRFRVGELAYIMWHDELCLVVINFVSQKLVACSDDAFEEGGDNQNVMPNSDNVTDVSRLPSSRRCIWLYDKNEDLFVDADSHEMYSRINALEPLRISLEHGLDYTFHFDDDWKSGRGSKGVEEYGGRMMVRHYFMPIYFVTFPGYKKRCAKTFRFWVKEKDLIKLYGVHWPSKSMKKPDIDLGFGTGPSPRERIWAQRDVENINEYVYSVVHNKYYNEIVSGKYHKEMRPCGDVFLPWNIPSRLKEIVSAQQHSALLAAATLLADPDAKVPDVAFSLAPLDERLSAHSIIQNFKYILLIIGNLIRRTFDLVALHKGTEEVVCGADVPSDDENAFGSDVELDEMCVPSLRFLDHLESAIDGNLSYQQYFDIYLNNIYWLDFYLEWMDTNFLSAYCYNEYEYRFIIQRRARENPQRPLSKLLGFEHLSRLFCFDHLYRTCLGQINRGNRPFAGYLPITQLLIQYLAFVGDDYWNTQEYGIDRPPIDLNGT